MAPSVSGGDLVSVAIHPQFHGKVPGGPVLLVDDMVDSRWTLTIAAWLLLNNGSGPVWPLALAQAGGGND